MDGSFLTFAGIVAVAAVLIVAVAGRADRREGDSPLRRRLRRGAGNALLGLQQFVEPSVEHIIEAQNVEQKDEEDDDGLGADEEAVRSDLAEALGRSPVDPEEIRRHLAAAARAGLDWRALYERAVADELRERPYRAPSIPPTRRVAPRAGAPVGPIAGQIRYNGDVPSAVPGIDRISLGEQTMSDWKRWGFAGLSLALAAGWSYREVAFAQERARAVQAATINLDELKMVEATDKGQPVGENGVYLAGETPASKTFVTGRFVLPPGKSPHAPHTHVDEEVMIIERGHGEIFCDGKTTKIGPGSVMYTTPNAPHGITNTGDEPIVFYYVKWEGRK